MWGVDLKKQRQPNCATISIRWSVEGHRIVSQVNSSPNAQPTMRRGEKVSYMFFDDYTITPSN